MANRFYDEYRQPHNGDSAVPNTRPMKSPFATGRDYGSDMGDYYKNIGGDDNPPKGTGGSAVPVRPEKPKNPRGPRGGSKKMSAPKKVSQEFYPTKKLFETSKEIVNTPVHDPSKAPGPVTLPRRG